MAHKMRWNECRRLMHVKKPEEGDLFLQVAALPENPKTGEVVNIIWADESQSIKTILNDVVAAYLQRAEAICYDVCVIHEWIAGRPPTVTKISLFERLGGASETVEGLRVLKVSFFSVLCAKLFVSLSL